MAVFSASNVAPLLCSQSSASLMMALIPSLFVCAVGLVTYAVKSSTNAIALPYVLMRCCTRSALKKRNRAGDSGDPCGKPACGSSRVSDACLLTWIDAVRCEQNASTHLNNVSGMPCAFILCSSLSLHTLLYAPLTLKVIKLTVCWPRQAV